MPGGEGSALAKVAQAMQRHEVHVLDARRDDERARGGVAGSRHIPLHVLRARIDDVPDGEVWVYCGSGYRASIAASMLDRPERDLVLVTTPSTTPKPRASTPGRCPTRRVDRRAAESAQLP